MSTALPTLTFNFAPDAKRPTTFPPAPQFLSGFVPSAGDGITFVGSEDIYVVVSRVFSFDEKGETSVALNLAQAGSGQA